MQRNVGTRNPDDVGLRLTVNVPRNTLPALTASCTVVPHCSRSETPAQETPRLKDILPDLDLWQSQGEEIAMATLVQVRRSAPRPPGARLCVTRSGLMSGSVSGGCVEADVFERAMQVLDSRTPALANYGIADEMGFEVGLSCGGSIDVFIEPFASGDEWEALRRAVEEQQEVVHAIGLSPAPLLGRKLTDA